ncbi:hypothetical protein Mbo4_052 [Rhodococcus phage Mbo4]|uniref:Uncharacterized protein n=2 Tax=root TaxID=1 RepID=A0A9E7ISL5_9CAUD|nr:hypothetical protein [Rhodococcus opacus]YP_010755957.1 hypothetical protein QEH50_gp52 [Rhodococcus phage Mbo4]EKT83066.1 hypothetical protein WSS_A09122 [Rhodococcus opacus M213]URG17542.1 hypothetical protein Mbo4_052 [Rhodococcus phage Mbo4]
MSDALDVITVAIERSPGLPPKHVAEVVENDLVNARLLPDPDDDVRADHVWKARAEKAEAKHATKFEFHEVVRWAEAEGWELVNIAQQIRLSEQREQEKQSEAAAKARWRNRAEEAEATVARVEKVKAEAFRPGDDWRCKVVLEPHLAAALEGGE